MNQDKMHLVNKIFNNETIRTVWDKEEEKYYISIVDLVGVLSESENPRNYWKVLKHRLKREGNESVTNCNQLKLKASDGKYFPKSSYAFLSVWGDAASQVYSYGILGSLHLFPIREVRQEDNRRVCWQNMPSGKELLILCAATCMERYG